MGKTIYKEQPNDQSNFSPDRPNHPHSLRRSNHPDHLIFLDPNTFAEGINRAPSTSRARGA
ncbi:hypothetical protein Q4544_05070 [Cognatishimia sp. 1_MG-2023]|uniref:hypothetical protein n=1 Tax=Cognatishimia sp. 1_MG-2023 TaxID=3062642 RepID=UPI0026E423C0|nr:hypothetical protein [Cognatishimia sp. 1_MG-2023]MDO6726297.1 hypothetical protein [Cognatishimia sp. 1_MG-2023]